MIGRKGVLVGIVTFNRRDKVTKALDECRRLGFHDVVVFDNGSTDGTREILAKRSGLSLISSERNEGCSAAFNGIMRFFVERSSCNWLLTFDDDAYPTFTCQSLTDYLSSHPNDGYSGYALRVIYPDGVLCPMNRPGLNMLDDWPLRHLGTDFHINESTKGCSVDFASFTGLVLKSETVLKVGIVSRHFYIYSDDTYYTLSVSRSVSQLYYCPEFTLVHDCKRASRDLRNVDQVRLEREVINKIVMIREFSRLKFLYIPLYLVRLLFHNPRRFGKILRASRKGLGANLQLYRNEAI